MWYAIYSKDAQAWAKDDPYVGSGAWASLDASPFLPLLP